MAQPPCAMHTERDFECRIEQWICRRYVTIRQSTSTPDKQSIEYLFVWGLSGHYYNKTRAQNGESRSVMASTH